jgi:hypothetical protein
MRAGKILAVCSIASALACGSADDGATGSPSASDSGSAGAHADLSDTGTSTTTGTGGGGAPATETGGGGGQQATGDAATGTGTADAPYPMTVEAGAATPIGDPKLPRILYIENHCTYTIWNFAQPAATFPNSVPLKIDPGQAFAVGWSDNFSGRVWGRSECTGTGANLKCAQTRADSLAEWTLTRGMNSDWYDVSLVDGFTIPMGIIQMDAPFTLSDAYVPGGKLGQDGICGSPICAADLNANCPAGQQQKDAMGKVVGCVNGMKGPSAATMYFKAGCPTSYTWDFDDPQSLFRCPDAAQNAGKGAKNYKLIYCPTEGATKGFP